MKYKIIITALLFLTANFLNAQEKHSAVKSIGFNDKSEFSHKLICNKSNSLKSADDQHWNYKFDSTNSPNGPVYAIAVKDSFVYIGGRFKKIGSLVVNNIARWDGHSWTALGDGFLSALTVQSIALEGNDVYAGGLFSYSGITEVFNIAKWDGSNWSAIDSGTNNIVNAMAIDQSGNIFAGGCFTKAGSDSASHIAEWNNASNLWTNLGAGIRGTTPSVYSMVLSGTNLIVGGTFSVAGGDTAKNIALWNGTTWSPVGGGTDSAINSLTIVGTNIYAAGKFTKAGGISTNHYARWNGTAWSDVDGGVDYAPESISGCATDVYVASSNSSVGANNITKYDCCWDPLGSGLNNKAHVVLVNGDDVWVGGEFTQAGNKPSYYFAHWNYTKNFAGISETIDSKNDFVIYPNPASKEINVNFNLSKSQKIKFTLFDLSGRKMFSNEYLKNRGSNSVVISLPELSSGTYILECSSEDFSSSKKLIVE
jgi:hypothetical protein